MCLVVNSQEWECPGYWRSPDYNQCSVHSVENLACDSWTAMTWVCQENDGLLSREWEILEEGLDSSQGAWIVFPWRFVVIPKRGCLSPLESCLRETEGENGEPIRELSSTYVSNKDSGETRDPETDCWNGHFNPHWGVHNMWVENSGRWNWHKFVNGPELSTSEDE